MSAREIRGREVADSILDDVAAAVERRRRSGRPAPYLSALLDPDDTGSVSYTRLKKRACEQVGVGYRDLPVARGAVTDQLLEIVRGLNHDDDVSGVLVQLPLPPGVDSKAVIEAVDPVKDVDGFHPYNAGRLALGEPVVEPCTPAGIVDLVDRCGIPLAGASAVIVGRSNIVGKPLALMLIGRNATVTVCHTATRDLGAVTRGADLLVVAAGRPGTVDGSMVKRGAAVVDVGVNRVDGRLVGDCSPDVAGVAGWLTPVPGGVGPMTVAMLMRNTLRAEERRRP
jgi:methylenetetrahydrofolate dehydrogenase (NADP+)/methenyltetrahydrofolate cyclohydrolase